MKAKKNMLGALSLALAIVLVLAACPTPSSPSSSGGSGGATGDTDVVYRSYDASAEYMLTITKATGRTAYEPKNGDSYKLVITFFAGGTETSSGTVTIVTGGFTLKPSNAPDKPFTVTISSEGITAINGTITFEDGTDRQGPGETNPGSSEPDSALNGTWVPDDSDFGFVFNDGNFEQKNSDGPMKKGTYNTSGGKLTLITTHIWGFSIDYVNLEKKWYSKAELMAVENPPSNFDMFSSVTVLYSVSGTKLTMTFEGESATFTNKSYKEFKLADNQPDGYPTVLGEMAMAAYVENASYGTIRINVCNNGILGEENATIGQTQAGTIDFVRVGVNSLSSLNPIMNALAMPFLFRDKAHMFKVLDGPIGQEIAESLKNQQLLGLCWLDAGFRNFYNSKKSISSPGDMAGLKIRVQNTQLMKDIVEALGATSNTMGYGEVYSGIQGGTIDGAENNWPSYIASEHYKVAKYFTVDEHMTSPEMILNQHGSVEQPDRCRAEDHQRRRGGRRKGGTGCLA